MTITAEVSIYLEVNDVAALITAARKRYLSEAPTETYAAACDMLPDGDISAALRMLLDPGISPDGCEIIDSACEVEGDDA